MKSTPLRIPDKHERPHKRQDKLVITFNNTVFAKYKIPQLAQLYIEGVGKDVIINKVRNTRQMLGNSTMQHKVYAS